MTTVDYLDDLVPSSDGALSALRALGAAADAAGTDVPTCSALAVMVAAFGRTFDAWRRFDLVEPSTALELLTVLEALAADAGDDPARAVALARVTRLLRDEAELAERARFDLPLPPSAPPVF